MSVRTQEDYDYYLNRITLPVFGDMKVTAIRYANVKVWQLECKLLLGDEYIQDAHLFRHETGAPIRHDVYGRAFKVLLKQYNEAHPYAELPLMPIYNARHSWATNARGEYHLDPEVIAAVMRHGSVNTSFENYVSITEDRLRQQMPAVAK